MPTARLGPSEAEAGLRAAEAARERRARSWPLAGVIPAWRHRADIDGLRAVAVVPVLLFHGGFQTFGGGFVGVDVFFVISGYLITSIILDDMKAGRFSIVSFYERRIRRIFPALFAMLLVTLVVGCLVLVPNDLRNVGQSAVAAALSASNVLFWRETGYFGIAEQKPLLNTWSLGVEEQFYLGFPLVLLLLAKLGHRRMNLALAGLLLLSFALAVWSVQHEATAAFYLAPMRAWELLLGALLALGMVPRPRGRVIGEALSLLGLGLIAFAVFTFSAQTPFPGASALVPCVGACLLILAGAGGDTLVARMLAVRPLVFVGLISYSLYLWHWPLLAFSRYYAIRELTSAETCAILLLSAAIAVASWRWIERPFRTRLLLPDRRLLFAGAASVIAVTTVLGLSLHFSRGWPQRLSPEALRFAEGARDRQRNGPRCTDLPLGSAPGGSSCRIGASAEAEPSFVLWGDSHAKTLQAPADEAARRADRPGLFARHLGCPPLLGVSVSRGNGTDMPSCRDFNATMLEVATRRGIDTVILAAHWSLYATGVDYWHGRARRVLLGDERIAQRSVETNEAVFRRGLTRTVEALVAAGKRVVIVAPIPEVDALVPSALALTEWLGREVDLRPSRPSFQARQSAVLSVLGELEARSLVEVVYPHSALCDEHRCHVERDGRALYYDDNHLTLHGAGFMQPLLEDALWRDLDRLQPG